ncbi:MAG: hypothetical protein ACXWQ5_15740 [Ktedonobacterales bacterium]
MLRVSGELPDADAWKRDRVGAARRGEHPLILAPMPSGYAVLGDTQFLPGYCVLLASPRVEGLNDLMLEQRREFLLEMALLGDAVMAVCQPERIDYAIMGDADHFLQAHVHARYDWEPEEYRNSSAFSYPRERWTDPAYQYSEERHGELQAMLSDMVLQLVAASEGHVAE